MEKIKTSISLDKQVYETIKTLGKEEERTFSQQVNKILKEYINAK